ncbi:oligosaccharide flippase family protein [Uliginosibacterium aquaticum]|uniref:Oligosaccharide flippase family protein n=1 Tax=Uliginosibacterium aquaticum TaxID=2731212 RepID=A0ABX2IBG4_9RHOO|nr:oligosaccharide flippase family protein [Uliginosibacterium aquaticum]NSL53744.1 oligosaccharide flippase family protein [Uliginosibacterium aquaticum]
MKHGQGLVRHTVFNLMGTVLPLMFAVVSVPLLIHLAGSERFGFLALMWAVAGYAGLLDLGLSRTMARRVAQGTPERPALAPSAVWQNFRRVLMVGLGVAALLQLGWSILGESLVRRGDIPLQEIDGAVRCVALMVPCIAATSALRGVLEGALRFGAVNLMRGGFTVAAYCVLIAIALLCPELPSLTAGVLMIRVGDLLAHILVVKRELSGWLQTASSTEESSVWSESAWFMCSQAIVPFTMYMDRFFVGSIIGLGAVAHYSVPYELATKLLLLPLALSSALFPRFASQGSGSYELAGRTVAWLMCLPCLLLIWLGGDVLHLWVRFDVAGESTWALIALVAGVWFNSVAQVPYAWLQARGFVHVTVGLHLCELPLYLGLTYLAAERFGIVAVAVAWGVRAAVDCMALQLLVRHKGGPSFKDCLTGFIGGGCVVLAAVLSSLYLVFAPFWFRWALALSVGFVMAMFLWLKVVPSATKASVMMRLGIRGGGGG